MMEQLLPLIGKLKKLRVDFDAHAAATSVHGAVSAATPSRLVIRDASGRAQVADPSAAGDIANRGWVLAQLSSLNFVSSVATGAGLTGGPITTTGTISLATSGVAAGSYNTANVTVDAYGRVTSIANGSSGVQSISSGTTALSIGGASATPVLSIANASVSVSGLMSNTDKNKLDGIQSGAQVNAVASVFGRTGSVVATAGDYNIQKISGVTISTSEPSGGVDGDVWFKVT